MQPERMAESQPQQMFLRSDIDNNITQSILAAWRVLLSLQSQRLERPQSSVPVAALLVRSSRHPEAAQAPRQTEEASVPAVRASAPPRPESPPLLCDSPEDDEEPPPLLVDDEEPPPLLVDDEEAPPPLLTRMRALPLHSETVTLIVYVYWRGVQAWDDESVREGWPSEMVSWHIKGFEYDLARSAPGEAGGSASFAMSGEQVGAARLSVRSEHSDVAVTYSLFEVRTQMLL